MPVTPINAAATLLPNLAACAITGVGTPQLAQALGIGLSLWTAKITIATVDSGAVGGGKGVPVPVLVSPSILATNLTAGMTSQGILGVMAPTFILGLAAGISQVYSLAYTNTAHVGVGSGSGVAKFIAPPATLDILAGFAALGMVGEGAVKLAAAIGQALDSTFQLLLLPQPIVGPSGPAPSAGAGFGTII